MSNNVPVSNFSITNTYDIKLLQITVVNVDLFTSARIIVRCFSDSGSMVQTYEYMLIGDDYANWGSDDEYIINYVKTQLNIQ